MLQLMQISQNNYAGPQTMGGGGGGGGWVGLCPSPHFWTDIKKFPTFRGPSIFTPSRRVVLSLITLDFEVSSLDPSFN